MTRPVLRSALMLAVLAFTTAHPAIAQRNLTSIPDPDPELERQSFQVADGFEVNLFAADPILAKPIQMNFDPAGRLWIVSSEVYPQIKPGQPANDKVLILEDRDGDGRSDKTTVFADGLLIPTGIEPGDGGAYVANSTELLHFADADGDGTADSRRVVLSGFGTEDTHHILHTLRWGYDGALYFNQSIYIHSHIETPHGVRRLGGGGIWRFRPETMDLEVFIRGLVNPWGHHFDRWGQSFATDGAGGEGINYCLSGAYYFTAPGAIRLLRGLNPGSPKYCGEEVLSGRHLPDDWQGNILTNDFRANRVCRYVISDDGAGFSAQEQAELIRTTHVAFRPIDIKLGPDGAIYIADWYNPIIQHGEVDFRDPRRDHTRGRIWRVTAKGRPLVPRPKLVGAPVEALLDALKAPEDWTRQQAKRLLKERGPAQVIPTLAAWVKQLDPASPAFEHERLEALWTYESLDTVEPELLAAVLKSGDPRARAAATRVAGLWSSRLSQPLDLLAPRVVDDHPRVRLEAVRALARVPGSASAEAAMKALDKPVDRFLDYGLWLTARDLEPDWLPLVEAGRFDFGGQPRHLVYALLAVGTPRVVPPLLATFQAGRIPADQVEPALTMIATLGAPRDLDLILDLATSDAPDLAPRRTALLNALASASRQRKVRPTGDVSRLARVLTTGDDSARASAAALAGLWHVESLRSDLKRLAATAEASVPLRAAAVDALVQLGGTESKLALNELSGPDAPHKTRMIAGGALAVVDPKLGAERVVALLADSKDAGDVDDLLKRLLQRREGAAPLVTALAGRSIPADAAKLAIRAARSSSKEDPRLIDALTKAGDLSASRPAPSADEIAALLADVARLGDPARGETLFRRKELACLKCHAVAGAGGQVGPSLESIGASAPVDYLVDSLLQPSKAIKENYHSLVVATSDGKVITGIKVRQSDSALILRDADDREVAIPLSDIDEQKPGGSLMPAGLTDSLTRAELVDLVRFLSELGKIGPYAVSKARLARRWQVLEPGPETVGSAGRDIADDLAKGRAKGTWVPAYTRVSGLLPTQAMPELHGPARAAASRMARAQVEVTTGGAVNLTLNSVDGLTLWLDGNRIAATPVLRLDLSPGVHTLTASVESARLPDGLRWTLDDVPGSPARAQWVTGK